VAMAASPMRRSDSVSFSPSTVPKSPGTLETPKSPGARRAAAGAHASTGAAMGTGAMAIIQNADMIEARLAILAEGKLDAEDALNEQAFIEECQLIIAKSAFPASAGAQAWKVGGRLRRKACRMRQHVWRVAWQKPGAPRGRVHPGHASPGPKL